MKKRVQLRVSLDVDDGEDAERFAINVVEAALENFGVQGAKISNIDESVNQAAVPEVDEYAWFRLHHGYDWAKLHGFG